MAEVCQIINVTGGKIKPTFHRREYRTESLAIATGIAYLHDAFAFLQQL